MWFMIIQIQIVCRTMIQMKSKGMFGLQVQELPVASRGRPLLFFVLASLFLHAAVLLQLNRP